MDLFNLNKEEVAYLKLISTLVLRITLSIITMYLSFDCNKNVNVFFKILNAIIAFLFAEIYIIYYAFYRVFMGNKCY